MRHLFQLYILAKLFPHQNASQLRRQRSRLIIFAQPYRCVWERAGKCCVSMVGMQFVGYSGGYMGCRDRWKAVGLRWWTKDGKRGKWGKEVGAPGLEAALGPAVRPWKVGGGNKKGKVWLALRIPDTPSPNPYRPQPGCQPASPLASMRRASHSKLFKGFPKAPNCFSCRERSSGAAHSCFAHTVFVQASLKSLSPAPELTFRLACRPAGGRAARPLRRWVHKATQFVSVY